MSEGAAIVYLRCVVCGEPFTADIEDAESRLPSVFIDPVTKQSPDVGGTDPARASREPLCPTCFTLVLVSRQAAGFPRWPAPPGGWPPEYAEAVRRARNPEPQDQTAYIQLPDTTKWEDRA